MTVVVRRILADDWRAWRAIRLRALRESPHAFETHVEDVDDREIAWRARIDAAQGCFVAELDGDQVGLVAADGVDPERIELQSMFVATEARRRGVGRALIEAVVTLADGRPVLLGVVEGNADAIGAYEAAGFVLDPEASGISCDIVMQLDRSQEETTHAR